MRTGVEIGWGGAPAKLRELESLGCSPHPRIPKSSPPVPYTLTQPSGHGAGEAGSQLDRASRGSRMQMILTSFLEVWGLSPR